MMIIQMIFSIVIIIIMILLILFFKNKKASILIVSISIILILFIFQTSSFQGSNLYILSFDQINLSENISLTSLSIKEKEDRKLLYDYQNNKEISYLSNDKEYIDEKYSIVYLRDLGDYYLSIYSIYPVKDYSNGRFVHNDYERNNYIDCLYIISKIDGRMFKVEDYEFIGKTIDLNSFQCVQNNSIIYNIFADFDTKITSIYATIINFTNTNSPMEYVIYPVINEFYYNPETNERSYVKKAVILKNHILFVDSFDYISYHSFGYFFENNGGSGSGKIYTYLIEDEEYIKQGYFEAHEDKIYFVGNDLKIYSLNGNSKAFYAEVIDLETWTEQLP